MIAIGHLFEVKNKKTEDDDETLKKLNKWEKRTFAGAMLGGGGTLGGLALYNKYPNENLKTLTGISGLVGLASAIANRGIRAYKAYHLTKKHLD